MDILTATIITPIVRSLAWLFRSLAWRWATIGAPAALALWFYLFPAYCLRWTWISAVMLIGLLLGYGNVKYFLLWLLCALAAGDNEPCRIR